MRERFFAAGSDAIAESDIRPVLRRGLCDPLAASDI